MCLQSLVNSDTLNETKISCKIDSGLKNITTSFQNFDEVVVESKPCEMIFVRKKDKQAQMMVAELSPTHVSRQYTAESETKDKNKVDRYHRMCFTSRW